MVATITQEPKAILKNGQNGTPKKISWEQFQQLYLSREDGFKYEWLNGYIEKTPRIMFQNQLIIVDNLMELFDNLKFQKKVTGRLITEVDSFFDHHHRRPDVAFYTAEQIRKTQSKANQIPAFVVEIISTTDRINRVNRKVDDYFNAGVPCITTNCPWQPYFFGRGGDPAKGFEWTYHFFWGLEDIIANFVNIWDQSGAAKKVGGLFPNDADGNAWGDKERGLPGPLAAAGYEMIDPGRYQPLNNDFSAQISAFKKAGVEIVTGVMIPPDFATFWAQAAQQGFKPKVVTIGKALLFPASLEALGDRGDGLTSEVWWSPAFPYKSSATGMNAADLAAGYEKSSGKQWTSTLGFSHALMEVALDVVKRAKDLSDPKSILAAITSTDLQTIVGPVKWDGKPVKNVSKTPLAGGQWTKKDGKYELVIVGNPEAPQIPIGGKLKLLN